MSWTDLEWRVKKRMEEKENIENKTDEQKEESKEIPKEPEFKVEVQPDPKPQIKESEINKPDIDISNLNISKNTKRERPPRISPKRQGIMKDKKTYNEYMRNYLKKYRKQRRFKK
jgi:hypothetical protein